MLTVFKRPAPKSSTLGPARTALAVHSAKMSDIQARREALHARVGALLPDVTAPDPVRAEIAQRKAAVDAKLLAAAMNNEPEPDVSVEREEIAAKERRLSILAERAAMAARLRAGLQAQADTLLVEYRALQPALAHLIVEALVETMGTLHPALQAAQDAYHTILRDVFVYATAIDHVSAVNRLGIFTDAARYERRHAPLPRIAPFEPTYDDAFGAGRAEMERVKLVTADRQALERDAQDLIARLLRNE